MAIVWTLIYVVISVVFIWWVLNEAKKLGDAHGDDSHGQNEHHDPM